MSDYVCEECWKDAIEVDELAPGYGIVIYRRYFHIVNGDHVEDIILTFENTPVVDPNPNGKIKTPEARAEKAAWVALVNRELRGKFDKFGMERAHAFISALKEVGWDDQKEVYSTFFYNRVAKIIADKLNILAGVSNNPNKELQVI